MSELILTEQASADTPGAGKRTVYLKHDGNLYLKDSTGAEAALGSGGGGGGSVTDHGALTGLTDDDHVQYLNNARGDARYDALGTSAAHSGNTSNPHNVTKAQVGLGNADNTSDVNKPISTAAQSALDAKQATLVSATNIKTINGVSVLGSGDLVVAGTGGVTDHGALTGLDDDDHAQYHNDARGDARYVAIAHVGSGGTAHSNVVASGAAGFMTGADKTKLDAISGTNTGDETGARIAALNHTATSKPLLVDTDEITGQDSANSFGLIRTTWTAVKAFLKTYFDTLYATLAGNTFTGAQVYSDQLLSRGMTKDMGLVFLDKGNSGTAAQTCDYTAGSHQKLTVTGAFVMNAVTNWPPTGNTGELLLELVNGASSAITWTMAGTTQRWWKRDGTEAATFAASGYALKASGTDWILMWSTNAGTTTNFKVQ